MQPDQKLKRAVSFTKNMFTNLSDLVSINHTALMVIDMQNDFIAKDGFNDRHGSDISRARAIIPYINELICAARTVNVKIFYLATTHSLKTDPLPYQARYALRQMDSTKALLCQEGTWGAELDATIAQPQPEDWLVNKYGYDGFVGTNLDCLLRSQSIKTVIATGVNTNLCVQTTVEHAFALGYYVVIAQDCVSGSTVQLHDAALENIRLFFGHVTGSAEIRKSWQT